MEYTELADKVTRFLFVLAQEHTLWVYLFVYFSCVLENLFPPYPGDAVIFVSAFLSGTGNLHLPVVFLATFLGSLTGALLLYSLGKRGIRKVFVFRTGLFFNADHLKRIEGWFARYGEKILVASRFIAGLRSGIALAAGVGNINLRKMIIYSSVSILLWNGILTGVATILKENYELAYKFLTTYNTIVLTILALLVLIWAIGFVRRKFRSKKA